MTARQLCALRVARPSEWARLVRWAIKSMGVATAAQQLGVCSRTMTRWATELGVGAARGGARVGSGRKRKWKIREE